MGMCFCFCHATNLPVICVFPLNCAWCLLFQSACWSRDGEVLLFAMEGDPVLHAVKFSTGLSQGAGGSGASTATIVADFSEVTVTSQEGEEVK